jgi:hypothetical protein
VHLKRRHVLFSAVLFSLPTKPKQKKKINRGVDFSKERKRIGFTRKAP